MLIAHIKSNHRLHDIFLLNIKCKKMLVGWSKITINFFNTMDQYDKKKLKKYELTS